MLENPALEPDCINPRNAVSKRFMRSSESQKGQGSQPQLCVNEIATRRLLGTAFQQK
jgi:hypothetical protein